MEQLDVGGFPSSPALFARNFFRRGNPGFVAFDLLFDSGRDLRYDALIDRKLALRRFLSQSPKDSGLIYADYIEHYGKALFERVCALDLEGIVAKHKAGV